MAIRLRVVELMRAKGYATAYQLAEAVRRAGWNVGPATVYRLVADAKAGRVRNIRADTLDALCDVLGVEPGDMIERTKSGRPKAKGGRPPRGPLKT